MTEASSSPACWGCCTSPSLSRYAGLGRAGGRGIAACAATLTRYEGWFLLPFVAVYFCVAARRKRVAVALLFSAARRRSVRCTGWGTTGSSPAIRWPSIADPTRHARSRATRPTRASTIGARPGSITGPPCNSARARACRLMALGGRRGRAVPARLLAAAAAGAARSFLRLEHALLRRHADLHSSASSRFPITTAATEWPCCRSSRWPAAGAGQRRRRALRAAVAVLVIAAAVIPWVAIPRPRTGSRGRNRASIR